jgi:hypothetical protein
MPDSDAPEQLPSVDALQFRRAQPINSGDAPESKVCVACKQLIGNEYYQVQNQVICPQCAAKIEAGRQAAKPVSMLRPVIYGAGAALAGCLLYAIVLAMGVQIGIVALAVGWMVGKAIRYASYGIGGRPQQVLAVALTYFAISTSFLPAAFFIGAKHAVEAKSAAKTQTTQTAVPKIQPVKPKLTVGKAVAGILVLSAISPFLELASSPVGGLISLFILFIGLQRAWAMTARHDIPVTGPYAASPAST